MKFLFIDSTALHEDLNKLAGPAYFSRHLVQHLVMAGHEVILSNRFESDSCRKADVVITEWCNDAAFQAAASGVCKKLIIRMRGYGVWKTAIDKLKWKNVSALVCESGWMKELALERHPQLCDVVRTEVLASGIDLKNFAFKPRQKGKTVALVARAVADKGHQLAKMWARERPDLDIHVTTASSNIDPRFVRYLKYDCPSNFHVHGDVDTAKWLDEIDANFLLSASVWETLGYTIVEGMAMGIKPLIHAFPGAGLNWPLVLLWDGFERLNRLVDSSEYDSAQYREFVEERFDAEIQSKRFIDLFLK